MANWSLDLPSLTDGYADEIHICTHGETSLKAEIRNQEGLGNKSDMESVLNFKRSGEGVFAVASTTNSLKVLVDFLTSPAVKIPVRALDVGMITPVEISKACKMSERKRKFFTILAFEAVVTPEASQLAELVGVKVICGLLSDFDFDDFLIRRISRGSIDALKANYRDVLSMSDWKLVCDLKYVFKIK